MHDLAPAAPLIEVRDLHVWFPRRGGVLARRQQGWVRAVDGVTFTVDRGKTLAIVGESGCGKTSTGRALVGLQRPTSGSVLFDGHDLATLGRSRVAVRHRLQMVFQDSSNSLDPRQPIARIISEPLEARGTHGSRRDQRVLELLELVGLSARARDRRPAELSGGQRQRVGIARAIAADPDLVVCDEPVSSLDVSMQAQILNLLSELQHRLGLTYVTISHDLAVVKQIADEVAVMYLGRVMEREQAATFFMRPRHPYSVALLSAVPRPEAAVSDGTLVLTGDPPSPVNVPVGCRFHPRCWLRTRLGNPEICTTAEPTLSADARGSACHFSEELAANLSPAEAAALPAPEVAVA